jgi:hypothetical protein
MGRVLRTIQKTIKFKHLGHTLGFLLTFAATLWSPVDAHAVFGASAMGQNPMGGGAVCLQHLQGGMGQLKAIQKKCAWKSALSLGKEAFPFDLPGGFEGEWFSCVREDGGARIAENPSCGTLLSKDGFSRYQDLALSSFRDARCKEQKLDQIGDQLSCLKDQQDALAAILQSIDHLTQQELKQMQEWEQQGLTLIGNIENQKSEALQKFEEQAAIKEDIEKVLASIEPIGQPSSINRLETRFREIEKQKNRFQQERKHMVNFFANQCMQMPQAKYRCPMKAENGAAILGPNGEIQYRAASIAEAVACQFEQQMYLSEGGQVRDGQRAESEARRRTQEAWGAISEVMGGLPGQIPTEGPLSVQDPEVVLSRARQTVSNMKTPSGFDAGGLFIAGLEGCFRRARAEERKWTASQMNDSTSRVGRATNDYRSTADEAARLIQEYAKMTQKVHGALTGQSWNVDISNCRISSGSGDFSNPDSFEASRQHSSKQLGCLNNLRGELQARLQGGGRPGEMQPIALKGHGQVPMASIPCDNLENCMRGLRTFYDDAQSEQLKLSEQLQQGHRSLWLIFNSVSKRLQTR